MTLERVTFEGHEGDRVGDASSRAIVVDVAATHRETWTLGPLPGDPPASA